MLIISTDFQSDDFLRFQFRIDSPTFAKTERNQKACKTKRGERRESVPRAHDAFNFLPRLSIYRYVYMLYICSVLYFQMLINRMFDPFSPSAEQNARPVSSKMVTSFCCVFQPLQHKKKTAASITHKTGTSKHIQRERKQKKRTKNDSVLFLSPSRASARSTFLWQKNK